MCIIWRHGLGSGGLQSMPEVGVVLTEESHSGRPLRGFPRGTWGLRNSPSPPVPWISSSFSYLATAWLLRSRTGPWWLVIIITIHNVYAIRPRWNPGGITVLNLLKKKKNCPKVLFGAPRLDYFLLFIFRKSPLPSQLRHLGYVCKQSHLLAFKETHLSSLSSSWRKCPKSPKGMWLVCTPKECSAHRESTVQISGFSSVLQIKACMYMSMSIHTYMYIYKVCNLYTLNMCNLSCINSTLEFCK